MPGSSPSSAPGRTLQVLVTGFGPFPGVPDNPSGTLALALAARPPVEGLALRAQVLPTTWAEVARFAERLAGNDPELGAPDLVVMLGVAARRRTVCVETLAFAEPGPYPDADGQRAPAIADGEPAQFSCAADPNGLVEALKQAGLPARRSRDAGRYICNALAYAAYRHAAARARPLHAVFVHIPQPDSGARAMPALVRGLEALIAALARQARAPAATARPSR